MASVRIEAAYALPGAQEVVALELPDGATALEAALASGLSARHGIAPGALRLGVGGRMVPPDEPLRDGDRVEILRPLAADPKEQRRARARRRR